MSKNKRRKPAAEFTGIGGIVINILIGSLLNIIIFSALCAVCSFLCLKTDIDSQNYKYFIFISCAVAGFCGGFKSVGTIRKNGLLLGALSALPTFFIIFLISSIISRTGISMSGWIAAGVMALFSAVGGILSVNKRR